MKVANVNPKFQEVAKQLAAKGGRVFVVGGAVRDTLRNVPFVDIDLMVTGVSEDVAKAEFSNVSSHAAKDVIGNAPVFLVHVDGEDVEIAMARREVSTGEGKHAFQFESHPSVSVKDDLARRDFTVNAMAVDVLSGELLDPFGGCADLKAKVLRHVSPAFVESPERVLRGFQQAARFGFTMAPETVEVCKGMKDTFHMVPAEQVFRHFMKFFQKAEFPEMGMRVLAETGHVDFFPEFKNMTAADFDTLNAVKGSPEKMLAVMVKRSGMKKFFFDRMAAPNAFAKKVLALAFTPVRGNARHLSVDLKHATVREFCDVHPEHKEMLQEAETFGVADAPEKRLVTGDHLKAAGMKQGPELGKALNDLFDRQMNGEFSSVAEGLEFVK